MQKLQNKVTQSNSQQQNRSLASARDTYDLAIVGSGISCSYTLIHYIERLKKRLAKTEDLQEIETVRIAVLDKSGEFWTGIPYGKRTGQQSLIITSLEEFLPQPERDRFTVWLKENFFRVLSSLEQRAGSLDSSWLESYRQAIQDGSWEELFVPRYLFGWYLQERVTALLDEARVQHYLECELFDAEVLEINKLPEAYRIDTDDSRSLIAAKIVLAIGSPPNKAAFLNQLQELELASGDDFCCITNMYEPAQTKNIERVFSCLSAVKTQPKQVLIIGSNASALETVYSLNNAPEIAALIDNIIVISPSGEFPHRIGDRSTQSSYIAQNLAFLLDRANLTAEQIYEAVKQDVEVALKQGETVDGTYKTISQGVIAALNRLNRDEQKQFVIKYGVKIGKYQRRAGQDYLNVVDKLVFQGKLHFIKGKFAGTLPLAENKLGFKFITSQSDRAELYTSPIQVIINCAGFQDLTQSSSSLINSLVRQEICRPNDSLCGFEMDENFAVDRNFFLMGPLVAGNINDKFKIWHAESCGRIFNLSQMLADKLI